MVQLHLIDEVSDPESLSSPSLFFFFFPDQEGKKNTITHSPWSVLMSEVRLHSNQSALIREETEARRPRPQVRQTDAGPVVTFCQGYDRPCLWMSDRNVVGVGKKTNFAQLLFPALVDKDEYDLFPN